jgi:hypothetical protein
MQSTSGLNQQLLEETSEHPLSLPDVVSLLNLALRSPLRDLAALSLLERKMSLLE